MLAAPDGSDDAVDGLLRRTCPMGGSDSVPEVEMLSEEEPGNL
jgi:hypothetical protein